MKKPPIWGSGESLQYLLLARCCLCTVVFLHLFWRWTSSCEDKQTTGTTWHQEPRRKRSKFRYTTTYWHRYSQYSEESRFPCRFVFCRCTAHWWLGTRSKRSSQSKRLLKLCSSSSKTLGWSWGAAKSSSRGAPTWAFGSQSVNL